MTVRKQHAETSSPINRTNILSFSFLHFYNKLPTYLFVYTSHRVRRGRIVATKGLHGRCLPDVKFNVDYKT